MQVSVHTNMHLLNCVCITIEVYCCIYIVAFVLFSLRSKHTGLGFLCKFSDQKLTDRARLELQADPTSANGNAKLALIALASDPQVAFITIA